MEFEEGEFLIIRRKDDRSCDEGVSLNKRFLNVVKRVILSVPVFILFRTHFSVIIIFYFCF